MAKNKAQLKLDTFFTNKRKTDDNSYDDGSKKTSKMEATSATHSATPIACDTKVDQKTGVSVSPDSDQPSTCTPGSKSNLPDSPTPTEIISLIDNMFSGAEHVHQHDKCVSSNCFYLTKNENKRLVGKKFKFQHGWLDMKASHCKKTGIWWPLYVEGDGLYCILCRKHDCFNPQNKNKIFNKEASMRFRAEALTDHVSTLQHRNAITAEMLQRVSCFQKEIDCKEKVSNSMLYKVFTILYWVVKEEIANKKALPLIGLAKQLGLDDLKYFQYESAGSLREMFLTLGSAVEDVLLEKLKEASHFGILIDEVTDISVFEQMVTFVQFFDKSDNEVKVALLSVDNLLEESDSANARTITDTIVNTLQDFGLESSRLSSLVTDGASVMTGKQNGVAAKLRQEVNSKLINIHCICHRLALACTDTLDDAAFFKQVQLWLVQLWKLFEHSAKKLAVYFKVQTEIKSLNIGSGETQAKKRLKKACQTRWLSFNNSVQALKKEYPSVLQTLNKLQDTDSAALGLLIKLRSFKFVSAIYILAKVLPHLDNLSKTFQAGTVALSQILPSVQYTKDKLDEIVENMSPVEELCADLKTESRLKMLDMTVTEKNKTEMQNMCSKYVNALKQNIDARFVESAPILNAFGVLNPTTLSNRNDPMFKNFGIDSILLIARYFELDEDEIMAEWGKLKYDILTWKSVDKNVFQNDVLKKVANMVFFYPNLSSVADIILSLPVSNAWPERGASAVKRIKTRMRSSLKNDMLQVLMQVSINGPRCDDGDLDCIIKKAVCIWLKKTRRKLPKVAATSSLMTKTNSSHEIACVSDAGVQTEPLTAESVISREELATLIRDEVAAYDKAIGLEDLSSSSDSDSDYM